MPEKLKSVLTVATAALVLVAAGPPPSSAAQEPFVHPRQSADWELTFEEEFQGKKIDCSRWEFAENQTSPDPGKLINCRDAVRLDGAGHLRFEVRRNAVGAVELCYDWLRTRRSQRDGYFEARVRFLKSTPGYWSAFWLHRHGANRNPLVEGFEIDIYEDLFGGPVKRADRGLITFCLHSGASQPYRRSVGAGHWVPDYLSEFHTVGCRWQPLSLTFYVDGQQAYRLDHRQGAISTVPLQMYVGLACFGAEHVQPDQAVVPDALVVDWIRAYQQRAGATPPPEVLLTTNPPPRTFEWGETLRVTVEASAREGELARVLLFDNGLLLEEKQTPPYEFAVRFDEEYFRARPYMMPSTATAPNGVVYQPSSIRGQHVLVALAEDRAGRVGHSAPVHATVSRRQARQRRLTDRDGTFPGPPARAVEPPARDHLVLWLRSDTGVEVDDEGRVR